MTWSASSDNRLVTGYNVYENDSYLTTVFTTQFVKPVENDGTYTYYVVAFDAARNFSTRSNQATVSATDNRAPFFPNLPDVIMAAGDDLNLIIAPEDTDGPVPGLFIGNLPDGLSSVDNFNGTRSLLWSPLQPDVGVYEIFVTAIDALDPGLQTTDSFLLTVVLPDDPSTIDNLPPGIDQIGPQIVRTGDTVIMEVKATDPNGTIPMLLILNLPEGATFIAHPEFANVSVLRWTTSIADLGINTLNFRAVDNVDNNLQFNSSIILEVKEPEDFVRPGARLKTLAQARNLDIGYASLLQFFNRPDTDLYQSIASEEFNLVTAENSMKWGYINPEPGEYRFDAADGLIRFADEHDMKVHGHTLVWYASLPQWVQQSAVSERESLMYDFIDTLTTRYSSVAIWDVVNEAFEEDGTYRNSVWFQAMGKEHVHKAFIRARANAPTARLIYNDYNIAYAGPKSDAVFDLLQELLEEGIPVDGVGLQMHLNTRFTAIDSVAERMAAFAALGLEIYITELDVSIIEGDNEQDQAELYAAITETCLAQTACKALQMWGFTDRYSWRAQFNPLVLDRNYQAKPAYLAIQEALE